MPFKTVLLVSSALAPQLHSCCRHILLYALYAILPKEPLGSDQERRKDKMGAWLDPPGRTWPMVGVGGSTRT